MLAPLLEIWVLIEAGASWRQQHAVAVLLQPVEALAEGGDARQAVVAALGDTALFASRRFSFEAQLTGSHTNLVKLFVHVTQEEQDKRFADRLNDPWKRWKTGADDYRNRSKRKQYLAAMEDMFQQTDTRWAPWTVIDGNNKKAARIAAMRHVIETLEAAVPMTPPDLDPAVVKLAHKAFGYSPKN